LLDSLLQEKNTLEMIFARKQSEGFCFGKIAATFPDIKIICSNGIFLWNKSLLAASSLFLKNILEEDDSFIILDSFPVHTVKRCLYFLAGDKDDDLAQIQEGDDRCLLQMLVVDDVAYSNCLLKVEVEEIENLETKFKEKFSSVKCATIVKNDPSSDHDVQTKRIIKKESKSKGKKLQPISKESINSNCFIKEPSPDRFVNGVKSDVYFLSQETALIGPPYACISCDYASESKRNVKLHFNRNHNRDEKLYKCKNCEKRFYHSSEVVSHWKRIHGRSTDFLKCVCDICGKMFLEPSQLKVHALLHSGIEYPCKFCERTFKSPKYLKGHESIHTSEIASCKICGKTFTSQKGAVEHEQRIHFNSVVRIPCDLCGKLLNSKDNLKLHIQILHNDTEKKHSCNICNLSFRIPSLLKRHVETVHEKSTLFSCPYCSQILSSKLKFKRHSQRKHNGAELPLYHRTLCPPNSLVKVKLSQTVERVEDSMDSPS